MLKKIKEWGKSLNNRLMGIILLCGIVPVIFIVLFVASSYRRGIMEKTESMVENEMEYVSSLISGRLNHAIEICKAAYDEEYENAWREYQIGKQSEELFRERVKKRLERMFYLEQSYDTFLFYEKGKEFPFCYSVREGGTVPDCMKNIHEPIREIRKQERLDVQMLVIAHFG